jgi:hypothetical protein
VGSGKVGPMTRRLQRGFDELIEQQCRNKK